MPLIPDLTRSNIFTAQFFDVKEKANSFDDYALPLPNRTSAISTHRTTPKPSEGLFSQKAAGPLAPFNRQFAQADQFRAERPQHLTGGYDATLQQWAFASGSAPGWHWSGGYDTVVCSRDVVISEASKQWCSAGGKTEVQWDEYLEDVVQPDQDVP